MSFDTHERNFTSRRDFLGALIPSVLTLQLASRMANTAAGAFGIAHGSFAVRFQQLAPGSEEFTPSSLPAEKFVDLCKSFGADGCEFHCGQLSSLETGPLQKLRKYAEDKGIFLQLFLPADIVKDAEKFTEYAAACRVLGVSRIATALGKVRFEQFSERAQWEEFTEKWRKWLAAILPILQAEGLSLGIKNNQDWTGRELADFVSTLKSPQVGVCFDFGNNISFLEDPLDSVQWLAPHAVSAHLKDVAINVDGGSFSWTEVPLGQGILPLSKMIELLRRSRPDIRFCLEMITRDPGRIEYEADAFWATLPPKDERQIEKFKNGVLSRAASKPLPRISGMSSARMLATEDDNIRRSVSYSRRTLGF